MKILLVDDERDEREGVAFLIRKFKYPLEIFQASNGKNALDILEKNKIDILFTDVEMPLMSGLELARIVREKDKDIKIIIFSAYAEFEYAKQAVEMHALRYLLKPIELDEFKELMDKVILSLQETQYMDVKKRKGELYKVFSGTKIDEELENSLNELLFSEGNEKVRFLNIEFEDNYFEEHEEYFLKLMKKYLGEKTDYVELFPNEACVLLTDSELNKSRKLQEQINKFVSELLRNRSDEMILFISSLLSNIEELTCQIKKIADVKRDMFGYSNRVIEMERYFDKTEHYVLDIESARRQLISAIDSQNPDIIRRENHQFVQSIWSTGSVSRIYIQNMLYTVLKMIYDKIPGVETKEVLTAADEIFKARSSKQIIETYENIIEKMTSNFHIDKNESEIILKIKSIVERDFGKDIGLDYIAAQVHLAPSYVSYIFKQETGQTLIKYVTDFKMEKARKYLEDMDMKIVQVGRACGYQNQSYFNRLFKNYYGVTPKQYRERL